MDIKSIISQMTLKEKASLCSGKDDWHTKAVSRLNVPPIMMSDGPHGVRKDKKSGNHIGPDSIQPATCFPTSASSACSWDRELLSEIGNALGEECLEQGISVLLGPGENIKRSPLCGRNFEYFSEDPFLSGEMAAAWIAGVQETGVGACLKHFAVNNQEYRRMTINAVVDERALREIYLAGFEAAVKKARPWMVMCAYNRLNGDFCSENDRLLNKILRDEWGFDGVLVTDWGACNDRVKGLAAGQDLEMPASGGINDRLIVKAVKTGKLDEAVLDRAVERLLRLVARGAEHARPGYKCDMHAHHALARRAAAESAVLLRNEGHLLPLERGIRIAVIGAFARTPRYQGSGSSLINPAHLECAWDELLKYSPDCTYTPGYRLDSDAVDEALIRQACDEAESADVAVVFAGLTDAYESEGFDRDHMRMPESHNALISRVAAANPNTVVVLSKGAPVEMPWLAGVKAVLDCCLAGEGGGGAAADLLFGESNPSGKLAEAVPLKLEDVLSSQAFPAGPYTVEYRESVYVGYRWFDSAKKPVLFPFGHGLSYTKFEYSWLTVSKRHLLCDEGLAVNLTLKNTGEAAGAEVVQLYVRDVCSTAFRPDKELKGFEKVRLEPGEQKRITFSLGKRAFACYNPAIGDWQVESGEFEILAGASSADIRLRETVRVESDLSDASVPDLHDAAPAYYEPSALLGGIPDAAFEAVCGCSQPQEGKGIRKKLSQNSTMADVRRTLAGRFLYRFVYVVSDHMLKAGKNELGRKMTASLVDNIPLRNLSMMSGGWFPRGLVNGLLGIMNLGRVK